MKVIKKPLNYIKACEHIKDYLLKCLKDNLISAVVFGSYAMLVPSIESDLDLLVVVHRVDDTVEKILNELSVNFAFSYGRTLSITVLSAEGILKSVDALDPIIIAIFWSHDILFDRNNWFRKQMDSIESKILAQEINLKIKRGALVWTVEDLKSLRKNTTKQQ